MRLSCFGVCAGRAKLNGGSTMQAIGKAQACHHGFECRLSGPLPSQIVANMSSLRELDLSNNQFTGFLPSSWGNSQQLASINLANNSLEGHVPQTWHASSQNGTLYQLNLDDNPGLCNIASGSALAIAGKPTCSAELLREQSRLDPASGIYRATPPPPPMPYPNEPFFLDTSPPQTYTPSPEPAAGITANAIKYALVGVVLGLGMLTFVGILLRRQVHHMRNQTATVRRGDISLQRRRLSDPAVPPPLEPQSPPCLVLGPDGHTLALATENPGSKGDCQSLMTHHNPPCTEHF
ncbi:TPA: hypothetical protein ACH3X1_013500 [Trebouxia sp. C0004]